MSQFAYAVKVTPDKETGRRIVTRRDLREAITRCRAGSILDADSEPSSGPQMILG